MAKIKTSLSPRPKVQVVTAGTAVPLSATPTQTFAVVIQADPSNNGNIFLGAAGVTAGQCVLLEPGRSFEIVCEDTLADEDTVYVDLSEIFVDAATSGDGVFVAELLIDAVKYQGG